QIAAARKLSEYILFTGVREDVPRILSGFDLFILPSFHEGLPMVLIEAQAAGLYSLISDAVPKDIEVISQLCNWMNLDNGPEHWGERLLELYHEKFLPCEDALEIVEDSQFNIQKSVSGLVSIYNSGK
ncbi:MAG: glycosyltransferase, partial [Planctomycetota bacterium]